MTMMRGVVRVTMAYPTMVLTMLTLTLREVGCSPFGHGGDDHHEHEDKDDHGGGQEGVDSAQSPVRV